MRVFAKGGFWLALFFLFFTFLNANEFANSVNFNEINSANSSVKNMKIVLINENILNEKVEQKLTQIGQELFEKSGILLAISASATQSLNELENLENTLSKPFYYLIFSLKDIKIKLNNSAGLENLIDKNAILENSIFPLLNPKSKDIYNAALLNGYADIAENIAESQNIKLESSLGNANRTTLRIIRILFYCFAFFIIIIFLKSIFKRLKGRKNV